ncbi:hypothetical protein IGI04_035344 [Brassica rapa subsp. trilocularis]|uniref:Uncharacterized protein n=1 Tax=Brassica rapa subsp. trilocularis TaxID=1813537 RepID=A0ABQ7LBE5_BRACM|nr:hypothetical protein IGI04_035344 [Brassica rapa subsp. trilocularis]
MGMGEPMLNLESVLLDAHRCLNEQGEIGQLMVTKIYVCSVPNINEMLASHKRVFLLYSLHGPSKPGENVPSAKSYPLEAIVKDCCEVTNRRISFEYAILGLILYNPIHGCANIKCCPKLEKK